MTADLRHLLDRPIAHRGLHNELDGVHEHTPTAIQRAIRAGLPIEVDIESSADQENFVFHDKTLDRLTSGTGALRKLPAGEIRRARFTAPAGEFLLTLDDLLDMVDGRVPLLIEFKSRDLSVIPSIVRGGESLRRYKGPFSVQSFNPLTLGWFREVHPRFTRGLITADFDLLQGRAQYILALLENQASPQYLVQGVHFSNCWTFQWVVSQGLPVIAWTVRCAADWEVARQYADNMMFEYISPALTDWRVPSKEPWRAAAGEGFSLDPVCGRTDIFDHQGPNERWWLANTYQSPVRYPCVDRRFR